MGQPDYSKIYRVVPLFRSLNAKELQEFIAISHLYKVKKSYGVVREGEPTEGMYIVVRGEAQVQMRLHQGDETRLAILKSGDVFGELSLLDRFPASATVVMRTDGILYRVDAEGFQKMRAALRPAAFKVMREIAPIICERLRDINNRVDELFADPERSMALLEKRYMASSRHAQPTDERG